MERLDWESKERVDNDLCRKILAKYLEDKKLFWRYSKACRINRDDGKIVERSENI